MAFPIRPNPKAKSSAIQAVFEQRSAKGIVTPGASGKPAPDCIRHTSGERIMRARKIGDPLAADLPAPTGAGAACPRIAGMSLAVLLILAAPCKADATAPPRTEGAQLAVSWNRLAYDIAFAEDEFLTFKGHRALAMMHLAMHDALNTIDPAYQRYAYSGERSAANATAAAAEAAHRVLVSQYPDQRTKLDAELALWLKTVPQSSLKNRGIELGRAAATAILAIREGDGWDTQGTYAFVSGPGEYETTPPWDGFVLQPGFRNAHPFALKSGNQFRPPPPPALTSAAYTAAFDEVKAYGSANSQVRSADQSGYAVWWMEFSEGSVNRLARQLLQDGRVDLWSANRMFAYLNLALFDVYIAVWDSKYEYNHWRPYTAVREATEDGNPATSPDASWEPLRPTPPFPEYTSAHAAGCAAAFTVLARTFGDDEPFSMETLTAPPGMPTRSFTDFSQAADECADSRVALGWHFRYATDEGLKLGSRVADYVLVNYLQEAG
jgi:PAP2 superfamily